MATRAVFQRTFDGQQYIMSDKDVLWLAVAMWGEKHASTTSELEASALAWCWLNRLLLNKNGLQVWETLWYTIKYHSQPVNPNWRRDGKFCRNKIGQGNCSYNKLDWRDKMASVLEREAWDEIPTDMLNYALRMSEGNLPQLADPTNVDFASTPAAQTYGKKVTSGGEWFLNTEQDRQSGSKFVWLPGTVFVVGQEDVSDWEASPEEEGSGTSWLLIGTWLVLTGWAVARLFRSRP